MWNNLETTILLTLSSKKDFCLVTKEKTKTNYFLPTEECRDFWDKDFWQRWEYFYHLRVVKKATVFLATELFQLINNGKTFSLLDINPSWVMNDQIRLYFTTAALTKKWLGYTFDSAILYIECEKNKEGDWHTDRCTSLDNIQIVKISNQKQQSWPHMHLTTGVHIYKKMSPSHMQRSMNQY